MSTDHLEFNALSDMPITASKGIGAARADLLGRLGIITLEDLFLSLPHRYEDRRVFMRIADIKPDSTVTVSGEIIVCGWVPARSRRGGYYEAVIGDGDGLLHCRWFGAQYLRHELKRGIRMVVHGGVSIYRGDLIIQHPEFETMDAESSGDHIHTDRIVPIYRLTEGLGQKTMRRLMWHTVNTYSGQLKETLPESMLLRWQFPELGPALREVHFPTTLQAAEKARFRLVFEEFLCAELVLVARKIYAERYLAGTEHRAEGKLKDKFITQLPFRRTNAQKRVIAEIEEDLGKPHPMHRLLQGDVGAGKTVVAIFALLTVVEGGAQVAVMAPTDVLVAQHHETLSKYLVPLGIHVERLAGTMPAARRRHVLEGISCGSIKVVVGTHALIQDEVKFKHLGLVIIDEQHKFGVAQRGLLSGKGPHPDVLVMTATPIPRTLAMTVYGDLDVSILDEMPGGRQEIVTRVIEQEKLPDVYSFIKKQVLSGRQAFMVFPLVSETDQSNLKAATQMYKELKGAIFSKEKMGLVHGQMDSESKRGIMEKFRMGQIDILVATTVVEVGVDVPNANVMLVVDAERYGLAQLHQLRGRIGRGPYKSYCILQGNPKTGEAWKRLKIMRETTDGFRIAEEDLRIRGMGNLLGPEQSGFPRLKVGDPLCDSHILKAARHEAFTVVGGDPQLRDKQYSALYDRARKLYKSAGSFIEVG